MTKFLTDNQIEKLKLQYDHAKTISIFYLTALITSSFGVVATKFYEASWLPSIFLIFGLISIYRWWKAYDRLILEYEVRDLHDQHKNTIQG
jgi:hypothetical protein